MMQYVNIGEQEFVLPKRSITSFIRTKNDQIICVKTSKGIDKKSTKIQKTIQDSPLLS